MVRRIGHIFFNSGHTNSPTGAFGPIGFSDHGMHQKQKRPEKSFLRFSSIDHNGIGIYTLLRLAKNGGRKQNKLEPG